MNIHPSIQAASISQEGWTTERVEQLKSLWESGWSCSWIAAKIGGVSRNAVIGKVNRLGLPMRKTSFAYSTVKPKKPKKPRVASRDNGGGVASAILTKLKRNLERDELPTCRAADIVPLHLPLTDLALHACHWPYGDGPFTFCGHQALHEKPYCRAHDRLAHSSAVEISEAERARRVALGKRQTSANRSKGKFS